MLIGEDLIRKLDIALHEAVRVVEQGEAESAAVGLTFAVKLDDDCKPRIDFTHKHTTTVKGSFTPARQPRLAMEP